MTVVIGYVHPGIVREGFTRSLAQLCLYRPNNIVGIIAGSHPRQEQARNQVITKFLEGPADYLMWIDTDMTFGQDAVQRMCDTAEAEGADMVTALGFILKRMKNEVIPNGYMWDPAVPAWRETSEYSTDARIEIDGTGSGFILIHRRVFEAWDEPEWHKSWVKHPASKAAMGHDLAFSYQATQEDGFKLVWDTGIKSGHIKDFILNSESYGAYRDNET